MIALLRVLVPLLALFLLACNEPPTDVGTLLINDTTTARQLSSDSIPFIVAMDALSTPSYLFNAGVLYIGRTPHLHATTLIRFTTLPDSLGWIKADDILGARLLLRPHRYLIGDSVANILAFTVHELRRAWVVADSAGHVTIEPRWPNLFSTGGVPNPDYFDPVPLAIFDGSQSIPLRDSLTDIEVALSSDGLARVARWLQAMADSSQRQTIHGIGFVPAASSTVVREFETQTPGGLIGALIRLRIIYRTRTGSIDSVLVFSGNDATFVHAERPRVGLLPVQSVVRTEVAMSLDVRTLPPLDAVLNAQLTIHTDTTERLAGNYGLPTTLELAYVDSTNNYTQGFVGGQRPGIGRFVFSDISRLIDYLRQRKHGHGTVLFRSRNFRLERLALYDNNAPDTLRPRLVITYIPRPGIAR